MQQDLESRIRERAYELWLADGGADGQSDRHWLAAEREILAAFVATPLAAKPRRVTAKSAKPAAKSRQRAA